MRRSTASKTRSKPSAERFETKTRPIKLPKRPPMMSQQEVRANQLIATNRLKLIDPELSLESGDQVQTLMFSIKVPMSVAKRLDARVAERNAALCERFTGIAHRRRVFWTRQQELTLLLMQTYPAEG